MIRLSNTTKKLQAVLGGAITTSQPQAVVSFYDENNAGEQTRGADQETNLNSTTDVDICNALGTGKESYTRNIDTLTIYNRDTVSATVTVKIDDGGTESILIKATIAPNETLTYDHESGWDVITGSSFLMSLTEFGGRLTLVSATPVMTTDQTAKTTVYFTPYKGNVIPLYNGTYLVPTEFTELSQATTDTTKSPAAVTTNSNYDLFVWSDSGTLRCTRGPAWSSDTSRGTGAGTTELELVKGVYLNKVAITNGPAANRGTYVGTVRSNGSSQIDWKLGSAAANGGEAFFGVWNNYNRVLVSWNVQDTTDSYTYQSTTIRAMNGSNTNRATFVRGLDEDGVFCQNSQTIGTSASGDVPVISIGLDATNAFAANASLGFQQTGSPVANSTETHYSGLPGIGLHYLQCVEKCSAAVAACQFYGDQGGTIIRQAFIGLARA